ncbi:pectate lyase family protein [Actinoalloteichus hymeniacidonis]|uniref:Pectate lyase n=1 Tax=Actinoalloteichus hymeniacidonis TaxID=340345 RepID=A0AAC9HT68_9PSEU|nr:glycosyl hydrolase family 28 protein [Actinoalloteichus hymeniacidonis]AOS64930.1 pectate lyase [Actinoalloteichus hymeniacidonis]MBB5906995.1 pectate lyase [Actinoalloteichus hymeniacidonis]
MTSSSVRTSRPNRRLTAAFAAAGALLLAITSVTAAQADPAEPTADPGVLQAGPIGWASTNGGTTGGAGGSTVTVTSASQLISNMQASGSRIIQVSGTINLSGMNDIASDKTLIGINNARINGGGIDVDGAHNVIIRNITFANADDDSVNVQDGSTNIWIDHNTFLPGYDGSLDIKRESDFVTVSWNHFDGTDKTSLLGHSDNHSADANHLRVTYHHNFYDNTNTRNPRIRYGRGVHVFNNYYLNSNEYGIASTENASVLVEGNYFQGVDTPTEVGYASSDPGDLVERNNVYSNSGSPNTRGSFVGVPYSYNADSASSIPSIVGNGAGVS